jgi:CheY-like chemotaxis protein
MFDPWQQIRASESVNPGPVPSQTKKSENTKSKRKKPTVLVVDDERLIADTMAEILKRSGFHSLCAYNGQSALELAIKANPDFVITDVIMPIMNGVQLAIAIRKASPDTQILLLSGQAGITDILDAGRKEGYSFELLAKPIHPEKLLQRLKKT